MNVYNQVPRSGDPEGFRQRRDEGETGGRWSLLLPSPRGPKAASLGLSPANLAHP